MKFSEVFGESITINKWGPGGPERYIEDPTLIKALVTKGGGNNALARDSVKALLDSIVPTAEETVCEELMNLQMPFASVTSTEMVASEGLLPEYCNVLGTIDNNITFEVKLPTDWNEKFYMGGGGGMVGGIQSQGWEDALIRGYATAGTIS